MKKLNLIIALLITIISSCQRENEFDYPLVFTGEVTNISKTGATFNADVVDLSKEKIVYYGFVWDSVSNPTLKSAERYLMYDQPKPGVVSTQITSSLKTGIAYYVRAFMKTINYTTYGKEVVFSSLGSSGPIIKNLFYKSGLGTDTVILYGKNFSYKTNMVNFSNSNETRQVQVVMASQDSLVTVLPITIYHSTNKISVSTVGNTAYLDSLFNNYPENSFELSKNSEICENPITITSNQVKFLKGSIQVCFGDIVAKTNFINDKQIQAFVPKYLNERTPAITIISNRDKTLLTDKFTMAPFILYDFNPKIAVPGETIILTGNNFSVIPAYNTVKIGGYKATVTKASVNKLEVTLPVVKYSSRNAAINVEILGESHDYNETLLIND